LKNRGKYWGPKTASAKEQDETEEKGRKEGDEGEPKPVSLKITG